MKKDCHMHMVLDGVYWKDAIARHSSCVDMAFVRRTLETYRCRGYTYLRDGGDRWGVGAAARGARFWGAAAWGRGSRGRKVPRFSVWGLASSRLMERLIFPFSVPMTITFTS